MTQVKRRKGWRMRCDVGEVTESLENETAKKKEIKGEEEIRRVVRKIKRAKM